MIITQIGCKSLKTVSSCSLLCSSEEIKDKSDFQEVSLSNGKDKDGINKSPMLGKTLLFLDKLQWKGV